MSTATYGLGTDQVEMDSDSVMGVTVQAALMRLFH